MVFPVSEDVTSSISPAMAFGGRKCGRCRLYLEDGANFLDVELMEVGGFDFAKQDILDLAGAEDGLGGHSGGDFWRVSSL
jgi:hypothetical protein